MTDSDLLLSQNSSSTIYLIRDGGHGQPVVRKVLNDEFPSNYAVRRFYNEHEITYGMRITGARGALERGRWRGRHSLLLPYVDGLTVDEAFTGGARSIADFLTAAIKTATVLGEIHAAGIIHNDISDANVIVNPDREYEARIIDFGNASRADQQQAFVSNPGRLRGNLRFISPEQTGRMNRAVDYRTDLYSLGVLLYRMLTGEVPFSGSDPMELVHCHIAVTPRTPSAVRPSVPELLSMLVMRLLAKNAEDRYQSAHGLVADLERCSQALEVSGDIEVFELGERDSSARFQIPDRLYGRDAEQARLLSAFARVSGGARELVLVGGYSGTGKTALVHETHKPITARRGAFAGGKYDQFQRNVPYFALVQAFEGFINQLLAEDEVTLARWRERIGQALGNEGRVLCEVIPSLELAIGPQPAVPELAGKESQNRFNYLFRRFTKAIARRDHPLVLFVDDLQWADSASLELLHALMTDRESSYLLCICAYRDNEVSPSHPFMKAVEQMTAEGATVSRIEVRNLPYDDANQLVADALHCDQEEAKALSTIVYDKTQGNAFFLRQFLFSLHDNGHLVHQFDLRRWSWDADAIQSLDMTDNVVELMAAKIRKLSPATQHVLTLGACVGNRFDFETLSRVHGEAVDETLAALEEARTEGLVAVADEQASFSHDRIQQAAYSLTPEQERGALHLRIGRILLDKTPAQELDERVFDIVNQLNQGKGLLSTDDERQRLAELNLAAGIRAKASAAYRPASEYLTVGTELLQAGCWETQYDLALCLWTERAESAYLSGQFEDMDGAVATVMEHARTLLDKVPAYETRILAHKARNQLLDAIDAGLEILAQLGVTFPEHPTEQDAAEGLATVGKLLEGRTTAELLELPEMSDPAMTAALKIIAGVNSSVYWARAELFPFMVFKAVELSVKHGNTATSAFGYSTYGVLLSGLVGDMKRAHDFGVLGLDLVERFDAREWLTQLYTPHYALIVPWNAHTRSTLKPLVDSYHIGQETGAIEYAVINANLYCIHAYLCGEPLDTVRRDTASYSEVMAAAKQETNLNFNQIYHQAVLNLMGRSKDPLRLVGDAYDEDTMLPQHLQANDLTASFFVFFHRFILAYLFGDLRKAQLARDVARTRLGAILAKLENSVFNFYDSLLSLALCQSADDAQRAESLAAVHRNQLQLARWAEAAPMNFQHKYLLVEAERKRVLGEDDAAMELYDRAIEGAREQRYLNEEALALELAGKFLLQRGEGERAERYLSNAHRVYRAWGAHAKVNDLATRYPSAVAPRASPSLTTSSPSLTAGTLDTSEVAVFDLVSVLKAASAISEEIVLGRLLARMMRIVLQSAGAQRGVLLLEMNGQLVVQAEADADREDVETLVGTPIADAQGVPRQVLQYVSRVRESVVMGDASDDAPFSSDPYLSGHEASSILCSPILNRGKLLGLLYLENHLMPHAFTQERMELLNLLSGQIATSLNNAMMFDDLERLVAERTASLEAANRKLERLSNLDGLTGLFNRRYFDVALSNEWSRMRRSQQPLSLIFCDVDFFKQYNDSAGHLAGDDCLRKLSDALRKGVRRPSDVVARYGGEEFVLLLPGTDRQGAHDLATSIQDEVAALAIEHSSSTVASHVTLSFGISCVVPDGTLDASELVRLADRALYLSKSEGRNRISFEPAPHDRA